MYTIYINLLLRILYTLTNSFLNPTYLPYTFPDKYTNIYLG